MKIVTLLLKRMPWVKRRNRCLCGVKIKSCKLHYTKNKAALKQNRQKNYKRSGVATQYNFNLK